MPDSRPTNLNEYLKDLISTGLGNPRRVQVLKDLILTKRPGLVFLMETMIGGERLEDICRAIGFAGWCIVDSVGIKRGLALFWRIENSVQILSTSNNYIDAVVIITMIGSWRFTGYYGYPKRYRRCDAWDFTRELHERSNLPWIMMGDFNDLISQSEKRGGRRHPRWLYFGY